MSTLIGKTDKSNVILNLRLFSDDLVYLIKVIVLTVHPMSSLFDKLISKAVKRIRQFVTKSSHYNKL